MDNIISNNVTKNIKYVNIADNELFDGHEQSILYNINDLKEVNTSYLFKSLNDLDIDGSLIANYRDNNELKQMFLPKTHKIILGTTGSGKTQSYILPYIHTISSFKNKHSMLITDVKGEIYKNCAHHLKEQGYEIKVLNFINPNSSNFWNPFYEICDLIDKSNQLNNNIKEFNSIPKDIINDGHGFKDLNSFQKWYYIDNKGFKVKEDAKTYLNITLEKIDMKIDKIIYNIAYSIIKDNDPKDRFWDSNARDIFRAVVWKFVEMYRNKLITRKQFNFKEIISLIINYNFSDIDDFIKNKPTNNLIMNLIGKIRGTATETKGTILTSLSSSLSDFKSYSTYYLTLEDEISLKTFDDKPIALFILLDELDKGIFSFIGLIVQTLYRTLNEIAKEKEDDKLTRPFEFILEEFGNVPKLENFTQMLSLSRSKDIWFDLVIQSYGQIASLYGKKEFETILDNINMEVFFGTNNYDTKELFSKKCGKRTIISPISYLNSTDDNRNFHLEEVSAVTLSDLDNIKEDCCYIRYLNRPLMYTVLERFYKTKEYDKTISIVSDKIKKRVLLNDKEHSIDFMSLTNDDVDVFRRSKKPFSGSSRDIDYDLENYTKEIYDLNRIKEDDFDDEEDDDELEKIREFMKTLELANEEDDESSNELIDSTDETNDHEVNNNEDDNSNDESSNELVDLTEETNDYNEMNNNEDDNSNDEDDDDFTLETLNEFFISDDPLDKFKAAINRTIKKINKNKNNNNNNNN